MKKSMTLLWLSLLLLFQVSLQQSILCSACHWGYNLFYNFATSDFVLSIGQKLWHWSCDSSMDSPICEQFFQNMMILIEKNVVKRFDPNIFCPKLGLCSSPRIVPDNFEVYKERILKNKPGRKYPPKSNTTAPLKFIVFADSHVDLKYSQNKSVNCRASICCRADSPNVHNDSDRPGKWGHLGNCDLPLNTAQHFIRTIGNQHKDAKFVLWLGDSPAHDLYNQTKEGHKKILTILTENLQQFYKGVGSLYPVVGNHEGIPCDQLDLNGLEPNWLFSFLADLWGPWLTKESQEMFRKYGRYSQLHPNTKLRVIALNSFVQDTLNSYIWSNSTDRYGQLAWLEKTLDLCEKNDESAIIVGHFPPFTYAAMSMWSKRYNILIDRYANVIRGQFFGHTHQDSFQVIKSSKLNEIAGVAFEHSSLTSLGQLNPSFRKYEMDPKTYELIDYIQFRFNLTKANTQDVAEWKPSYRFKAYYNVENMRDETFSALAEKILVDDNYFRRYAKMVFAEGPRSISLMRNTGAKKQIYCKLTSPEIDLYDKCIGGIPFSFSQGYLYFMLGKYFLPPWEYAI